MATFDMPSDVPATGSPPPAREPGEARSEIVDGVAAQVQAIDEIVSLARHTIEVFDRSLADGGWARPARIDALVAFLRRAPHARLSIIVHDPRWIETSAPRLVNLMRQHGDAVQVWRTGVEARAAMDPLVLVDRCHFVHRFHADQPRARVSIGDPAEARPLAERFDEIWQTGEPAVSGNVVGL